MPIAHGKTYTELPPGGRRKGGAGLRWRRSWATKLAENAGGAPALVPRAPEAPIQSAPPPLSERTGLCGLSLGDDEWSGGARHAKGWSGQVQRSVAAVAEKSSDECEGADDGSDGVQDAMTDEDARTRLLSQEPLAAWRRWRGRGATTATGQLGPFANGSPGTRAARQRLLSQEPLAWATEPGVDERSGGAQQAKELSSQEQRRVAAVSEKRSDECDGADGGSDGVQDAMADEDARTRLFRRRRRRQRNPYTEAPPLGVDGATEGLHGTPTATGQLGTSAENTAARPRLFRGQRRRQRNPNCKPLRVSIRAPFFLDGSFPSQHLTPHGM
eukprot:gene15764-biopygen5446